MAFGTMLDVLLSPFSPQAVIDQPAPRASKSRIAVVQYLRGIASLSVAWFHVTNEWKTGPVLLSGSLGWLGVELFFVISGFVIPYSIFRSYEKYDWRAFENFLARRLVRIEVPFLVSLFLAIALWHLSTIAPGFRGSVPHISVAQVILNATYLVPFTHARWLQPVYWTLGYEFAFYVSVGALFYPLFIYRRVFVYLAVVFALAIGALTGVLSTLFLLFAMGTACFCYLVNRISVFMAVLIVAVCGVTMVLHGEWAEALVGSITVGAVVLGWNYEARGLVGRILGGLGRISYSLYLVHVLVGGRVVNVANRFVHGYDQQFGASLAALAASIIAAMLFCRFIEEPAQDASKKLSEKYRS